MKYGITVLALVAIRREPYETSEMVSQLLFGECYVVLSEEENWMKISACYDKYEGWISRKQHTSITCSEHERIHQNPFRVLPVKYAEVIWSDLSPVLIGAGSNLPGYKKGLQNIQIANRLLQIKGYSGDTVSDGRENVLKTAIQFLYTPYVWGGRSVFGCDCSGFVQTVFKIHNVFLPRDAAQQSGYGKKVGSLTESAPCDLAFFMDDKKDVHHVGMVVTPSRIIHCSGYVRIDPIDDTGIYDEAGGQYTHRSFFIRRILHDQ